MRLLAAFICLPIGAAAEINGDHAAFASCIVELLQQNEDNFMAPMVLPIICGERHVPVRQSCAWPEYLPLDSRAVCMTQDHAFWRDQMSRLEADALADGRGGSGGLYDAGLERCDFDHEDADDRMNCETELFWRTSMEFMSAQAQVDLAESVE